MKGVLYSRRNSAINLPEKPLAPQMSTGFLLMCAISRARGLMPDQVALAAQDPEGHAWNGSARTYHDRARRASRTSADTGKPVPLAVTAIVG